MSERTWWRLCLAAGIALIAVNFLLSGVEGMEACGDDRGLGSVMAFELARSPADVAALFGDPPCTGRLVAAMERSTWIDIFAFIPAFTLFTVFGALAMRARGRPLALLTVAAAIVAALCDWAEDAVLLSIMADLPGDEGRLGWLFWFVHIKFALLAAVLLALGWHAWDGALAGKILGIVMVAGGAAALFSLMGGGSFLIPAIGLGWLALFILAGLRSFAPATDRSTI